MTYVSISEYIGLSKEERQRHLNLSEPCIEIGGSSYQFKGMLAHVLKTTIPIKKDNVLVCHACNNGGCSNQHHLYWGTPRDNYDDAIEAGVPSFHEKCVSKYGKEEWLKKLQGLSKVHASAMGKKYGGSNRLTKERIEEIRIILRDIDLSKYGWVQDAANKLGVTHTQVRRYISKYFPHMKTYRRLAQYA